MPNLPSIPLAQEKNTKLFLDALAGRGKFENRAILFADLVDMGLVQFKEGINGGQLGPGVNPGDVIDVPAGELPELPTTPEQLSTATSWGAIFVTWEYAAYNSEYGTEIHRSRTNDRNTASLIAVSTGRAYTDNVGEKETYFYWVRNRSTGGIVSGFNSLDGVQGTSNLVLTAQDFVLDNPEAEFQPFTIVNYGTELVPDWKILLNGQTIITSDLAIGQLLTGEMRPNTVFTVGNGSLEIGTDSLGNGYINVAGDGGIGGNDYLRITDGSIKSFIYSNGQHVNYKELRRVERGVANGGAQVIIPPFFKSEPTVYLTPHNISVYNPNFAAQGQTLVLRTGLIQPVAGVDGSWTFTPSAGLVLADAVDTKVENINTTTSTDYTVNSAYTFFNAEGGTVNSLISSVRLATAALYQKRVSTLKVLAQPASGGTFQLLATLTKEHGDSVTDIPFVVDFNFPFKGDWKLQYQLSSADAVGTFSTGADDYEYNHPAPVTNGNSFTMESVINTPDGAQYIQADRPTQDPSWILYKVDFKFTYNWTLKAWHIKRTNCDSAFPTYLNGSSSVSLPVVSGDGSVNGGTTDLTMTLVADTYPPESGAAYRVSTRNDTIIDDKNIAVDAGNQAQYLLGRYSNVLATIDGQTTLSNCLASSNNPGPDCDIQCNSGNIGTGKSKLQVKDYSVAYYYRRLKNPSTTPSNHYVVSSVDVSLGATDISLNAAVIGWLAVGE